MICRVLPVLFITGLFAGAVHSEEATTTTSELDRFGPWANLLNDMLDRRRRVIYTPYSVSPYHGVVDAMVHVSDGSTAIARTDMVVDARMPIVVRRAYHSDRAKGSDFGHTGWRLTVDERISITRGGNLVYTYGNGARLDLNRKGSTKSAVQTMLTDVVAVSRPTKSEIVIETRTGLTKRFVRSGRSYSLSEVSDSFGNTLNYRYGATGLAGIQSSDGAFVAIERDQSGRIVSIADSNKRTVRYGYEGTRLVVVTDLRGEPWRYEYDRKGRLTKTITSNGRSDLAFEYDRKGRVRISEIHGYARRYVYDKRTTRVIDAQNRVTTYRAAKSGITTEVTNSGGVTTAIRLRKSGLPDRLTRNGEVIAEFAFESDKTAELKSVRVVSPDNNVAYTLAYDDMGRIGSVQTDSGYLQYQVVEYLAGVTPREVIFGNGRTERVEFAETGDIKLFVGMLGDEWRFDRRDTEWVVTGPSDRTAHLTFDVVGQLNSVIVDGGEAAVFAYDTGGLRESTRTSTGITVDYRYDGSGNLFYTETGIANRPKESFTYVLGADQRVEEIVESSGRRHAMQYNAVGLPVSIQSEQLGNLVFGYDDRGRWNSISTPGGEPRIYEYAAGEPDIAAQLDSRTVPVFNQQREISDFGSRFDVRANRLVPATFGIVTFDEITQEFRSAVSPVRWSPMSPVSQGIRSIRLPALLEGGEASLSEFSMPSNRLFVPPEYWSVNCCFCCDPYDYDCIEP